MSETLPNYGHFSFINNYESCEFMKRLADYPGSQRFFQCSNTELCLSPTKIDGFPQLRIL